MLTLVTCPTCHHKFTVPEGNMGQRSTCPNCQSIFLAGKSVAETTGRANGSPRRGMLERAAEEQPQAPSPLDKTMLGEVDPPIRYNCPRCKKPLESPASEAGTKKPCPYCSGRLQVPAAPARPQGDPGLNKTLLASLDGCAPAVSPVPAQGSVAQAAVPQGKSGDGVFSGWRKYGIGALVLVVIAFATLYFIDKHNAAVEQEKLAAAQKTAAQEQEKMMLAQKQEMDKLRGEIEQKTALLQKQQQAETEQRRQWEALLAKQEARQRELDRERELQKLLDDKSKAAEAQAQLDRKQREFDEEKRRSAEQQAKAERDMKDRLDDLRRQIDNANQRSTTVIAPGGPAYPWFWGRYPWGW
jgi:DNA-directed RNA polymerase subunit RPC12/RpoP